MSASDSWHTISSEQQSDTHTGHLGTDSRMLDGPIKYRDPYLALAPSGDGGEGKVPGLGSSPRLFPRDKGWSLRHAVGAVLRDAVTNRGRTCISPGEENICISAGRGVEELDSRGKRFCFSSSLHLVEPPPLLILAWVYLCKKGSARTNLDAACVSTQLLTLGTSLPPLPLLRHASVFHPSRSNLAAEPHCPISISISLTLSSSRSRRETDYHPHTSLRFLL